MQPCVTDEFRSHLGQAAVSAAKVMSFKIILLICSLQMSLSTDYISVCLNFYSNASISECNESFMSLKGSPMARLGQGGPIASKIF